MELSSPIETHRGQTGLAQRSSYEPQPQGQHPSEKGPDRQTDEKEPAVDPEARTGAPAALPHALSPASPSFSAMPNPPRRAISRPLIPGRDVERARNMARRATEKAGINQPRVTAIPEQSGSR